MILRALFLLLICGIAVFPQNLADLLEQAPPDVDRALRENVTKFYQAHVDGKFRLADEFVAEDSKDVFFAADKRRCRKFEIAKLKYGENFTRATAVVGCDTEMVMPMGGRLAVTMPITTFWKVQDGRWLWYVPPPDRKGEPTPFGIMDSKPGAATSPGAPAGPVNVDTVLNAVKTDRQEVRLNSTVAASERVTVTNHLPGDVTLSLEPFSAPGLDLKLDRTRLGAGESAFLTVRFDPAAGQTPRDVTVSIVVEPTQRVLQVRITFAPSARSPQGH